jgi:Cys-tRNA(Pro)/Cys-tRNA(Cys) deacylase
VGGFPAKDGFLALLNERGVVYRVHSHPPLTTAENSAAVTSFPRTQLVKTLAFRLPNGRWALAALRAFDRLAYGELARLCDVRRADLKPAAPGDVETELGQQIGGVGPTTMREGVSVLFDQAVLGLDPIYCGYGRADRTLEVSAVALMAVVGGIAGTFALASAD